MMQSLNAVNVQLVHAPNARHATPTPYAAAGYAPISRLYCDPRQWRRQGEEGKLPPYGWTSKKLCDMCVLSFLQCFDTVGWAAGRASGL